VLILNKIFCKLGWHNWHYGCDEERHWIQEIEDQDRFCDYCGVEQFRAPEGWLYYVS
jgi:hypothetical protein